MSDNKKWFKVWGSILVDPAMAGLTLADMGRWVRLGAYISTVGNRGKLTIVPPAQSFLLAMEVESLADAKMALKRLPNVTIFTYGDTLKQKDSSGQIRSTQTVCLDDNGSFIVIMRNWFKYQVDSTAYERVKRSRYKKRGEEKLTSKSTSTPSATRAPCAGAPGGATRETPGDDAETLEQQEANLAWRQNTKEQLPESERMTPEEMAAIRIKNMGK